MSRFKLICLFVLTAGSCYAGDIPDPRLTPGAYHPQLTADILCARDFSTKTIRNVSRATKRQVYEAYEMSPQQAPCPCEVDHLISLALGGANDPRNLWPQSYTVPWNAHLKDRLENRMHREVCSGRISLEDAQREIATDWIGAYERRFRHAQ